MDVEKTENCKAKFSGINSFQKEIKFSINEEDFSLIGESHTEEAIQLDGRGK